MPQPIDEIGSFNSIKREDIIAVATALGFDTSKSSLTKKQAASVVAVQSILDKKEADTIEKAVELYLLEADEKVTKGSKTTTSKTQVSSEENTEAELFSVIEMTKLAKERLDTELTPRLLSQTMEATGLEDKKFYTKHEVEKWLVVTQKIIYSENDDLTLEAVISENVVSSETQVKNVIDTVNEKRAKAIPAYARASFLGSVTKAFGEEQALGEKVIEQMTENILADTEGKLSSISGLQWTRSNLSPSESLSNPPKLKSASTSKTESPKE